MTPETESIVIRAQSGDRNAMAELIDMFMPVVVRTAKRNLKSRHDAQDLCQDVFIQIFRKFNELRNPKAFPGWLRTITIRMSYNHNRKNKPMPMDPKTIQESFVENKPELIDKVISDEQRVTFDKHFNLLSEMDREALTAFHMNGLSLIAIAEQLNIPIGTVKRRLHVARKRLKKNIHHKELIHV